ncbi:uncharacterized protein BDZ99DRAFT_86521 [Mytilinidion resinicola]|uniref:Uncharacterized protein n=1 Tax=Mytilinidion resinicola TaxID=574789 RepID=A0A6A6YE91_9PEZI|nr:uncharacterized protein BDZ99DRAFT_86521 [Mytilinidion resinicola]KAF2806853.1 hypothetical protein BDZ99DRAFT_86521 [Mytilinidion resinicola]
MPGPPTTRHSPGLPVKYSYAVAAQLAACSLRKPMNRMPRLMAHSAMSERETPTSPKMTATPRSREVWAMT